MAQTLDQKRAQFSWQSVVSVRKAQSGSFDTYMNMAKGAPALIMGNGLMPALAYWGSRSSSNKDAGEAILNDVLRWLNERYNGNPEWSPTPQTFSQSMERLFKAKSGFYMHATDETLAMLKWLRQFAASVAASDRN